MSTETTSAPSEGETPRYLKKHNHGTGGFDFELEHTSRAHMRCYGKGTMDGARALITSMEEMEKLLAADEKIDALVDLTEMKGAPLRSQILMGKWMVGRRKHFGQIAVYGGGKIEMGVARAAMKIAGVKTVGFFGNRADAVQFLGW